MKATRYIATKVGGNLWGLYDTVNGTYTMYGDDWDMKAEARKLNREAVA